MDCGIAAPGHAWFSEHRGKGGSRRLALTPGGQSSRLRGTGFPQKFIGE
jgi:hypothetical protein